ncbi:chitosanase of glycosyl hydrolase group 75 [Prosthecobacter debontii]|uniref:Chitosanase of glycosyl hydrolase group 75 n=1 Tax=Prosthecobacter debontii TaxID=48467 RepID=A0A1T4XMQ7_9BACT|nr:glycoside hydrolase family 75 protein [Prosthecobacter debontii]SKA90797.1 chitosanase of glycosyl hydrolase group 75 [Prosthecobacter debontii]
MNRPPDPSLTPMDQRGPSPWPSPPKRGFFGNLIRFILLIIIGTLLVLPFTPFASKIKKGLKELIAAAQQERTRVVTKEVEKVVEVPTQIIKEVVKEVVKEVPAPPPPLPENYIPRKDVDVSTFYNGITIKTQLLTEQGTYASLERLNPEAYKAEFQLSVKVPKANQSVQELSRINPQLPTLLPDLDAMLPTSKVSGFYHKLYENKTNGIQRDITRLNRILDRHNFFDCETILELTHPVSQRKALLIQSEMDVVADGSDGDRMATLDEYIYMSDYYQPFTSYAWGKKTSTPNPLLSRWEERLKKAEAEYAIKGLSADRNRELKAAIGQLKLEIAEMKSRSSLIAEKDPFIVISLLFRPYAATNKHTPSIGDYAVVIHEGKMYPAICGDYGPSQKMGEASLFIAKAVNPKASPYRRPESDLKVTYLIFPGTAEKPNSPPNLERWHSQCATYLKEIGSSNAEQSLHRWEDPFKKPEPPATPNPLGGTTTTPVATGAVPTGTTAPAGGGAVATPALSPTGTPTPSNTPDNGGTGPGPATPAPTPTDISAPTGPAAQSPTPATPTPPATSVNSSEASKP